MHNFPFTTSTFKWINYLQCPSPARDATIVDCGAIPSPPVQGKQNAGIAQGVMTLENAIRQRNPVVQTVDGNISNGIDPVRSIRRRGPQRTQEEGLYLKRRIAYESRLVATHSRANHTYE